MATGLLLTAPGVPMLFMGQEFLADRWWSDDPNRTELLIRWDQLDGGDRHTSDFHLFCPGPGLRRSVVMSVSSEADPEGGEGSVWVAGVAA